MYLLHQIKKSFNRGLFKVLFGPQVRPDAINRRVLVHLNYLTVQGTAEQ